VARSVVFPGSERRRRPVFMLHAGLDLSRRRLDCRLLDERGERVEVGAAPPDGEGLRGFTRGVEGRHGPIVVRAAIESMNGARFVHDTLERCEPPGPTGSRTSTGRTRPHERVLASATGRCPVRPAR